MLGIAQGITGVLLQQFYHPMPDANAAYSSVRYMLNNPLLNFVRNLHYWGAELLLLLVALHMMRVYISAAYKRPRELLWVSGVLLLMTSWLLAFTGTVLRWDQEAVEALQHNLELADLLGPLGYWFSPSFAPDVPILIRLNSAHVTILPLLALLLVGLHIYLIRVLGVSRPQGRMASALRSVPFSTHLRSMIRYGSLALLLSVVLSLTVPAPLSSQGNPEIEVSKPDWYVLWIYAIENYFGLGPVPYVLGAALALMLLVPALDKSQETDPRKRKLMMALLFFAIGTFVALTLDAALTPPESHIG